MLIGLSQTGAPHAPHGIKAPRSKMGQWSFFSTAGVVDAPSELMKLEKNKQLDLEADVFGV